jgi:hypothetical protein
VLKSISVFAPSVLFVANNSQPKNKAFTPRMARMNMDDFTREAAPVRLCPRWPEPVEWPEEAEVWNQPAWAFIRSICGIRG